MANSIITARRPLSTPDLAWAAGFLEGEGWFGYFGSARVSAAQNQREPLDRLLAMFGGRIWLKAASGIGKSPIWTWVAPARRSVEIMMTLYLFMSPKRQFEIEHALSKWRVARTLPARTDTTCGRGHPLTGYNAMMLKTTGRIRCRECINAGKRLRRAARELNTDR